MVKGERVVVVPQTLLLTVSTPPGLVMLTQLEPTRWNSFRLLSLAKVPL